MPVAINTSETSGIIMVFEGAGLGIPAAEAAIMRPSQGNVESKQPHQSHADQSVSFRRYTHTSYSSPNDM